MTSSPTSQADYDVIIAGGSFSGAAAALLLKRDLPDLRILIVERKAEFDKKVGESTSEVGGSFLTRVLNLSSYLSAHHINKHGLRMWFCNDRNDSPYECTELGPRFQSRLPTYQLDRSTLDEHILAEALKLGCDLHRPATVRNIVLNDNDAPHSVEITLESGEVKRATCRWLLDASGKATLLGKQLGTVKPLGEEHPTSSVWTRYRKVNDVDSAAVRAGHDEWTSRVWAARSVATNHLMGRGWWCWLIPLSDGTLSAGIVWDRTLYDLPPGENMASRLHAHLLSHPVGKLMFEHAEQVEDDLYYYKNLSYYNESMCGNRWALLGDAAGFIDPLYSQGLDYCGHTVYAVTSMLKKDFRGECIAAEKAYMGEGAYGRSYRYWFEALYKGKYHYMGDAELMWAAFLMDLATYFIGPVRLVYSNPSYEWTRLPYDGPAGKFFAQFMAFYNGRLKAIATKRIAKGIYGMNNLHHSYLLKENFAPNFGSFKLLWQGIKVWIKAEISTVLASPRKEMAASSATTMEPGAATTRA